MATQDTLYDGNVSSCCKLIELAIDQMPKVQLNEPGVLKAIKYSTERSSVKISLSPGGSRPNGLGLRKIYTKATMPNCNPTSAPFDICDKPNFGASTANPEKWIEHTINETITREFRFDNEEYREFCSNPTEVYARLIKSEADGVIKELNQKLTNAIATYVGSYASQTAPINSLTNPWSINPFNDLAQGYSGYAIIKDQYAQLGYSIEEPIVIGGSVVAVSENAMRRAVGYNQAGYAPDMFPSSYVDYGLNSYFADGNDHLLTFIPGTLILAQYNDITEQYIRDFALKGNEANIITSPFGDGLRWDFQKILSDNACQHVIRMKANFDVLCPIPYNDCAKKPILHFLASCQPNECISNYQAPNQP